MGSRRTTDKNGYDEFSSPVRSQSQEGSAERRRRRRRRREAQLRRRMFAAIALVAAAALFFFLILPRVLPIAQAAFAGGGGGEASDVVQDAADGESPENEASTLSEEDVEDGNALLLAGEDADSAGAEDAVLQETVSPQYSYFETSATIDLGESLTDISIYDAQRHIAQDTSDAEDEMYGDDGGESAEDSESEEDTAAALADNYIDSQYVIVVNADTGEIIAERNAFDQIIPASMTKVMTLLVAVEAMDDPEAVLSDTFTMTQEICDESYLSGSSFVGYGVGDVATIEDLLYGTILPSGADAAMGLAEYTAGSQEAFVVLMNEKCEELGIAETTHFTNVVGLYDDGENYSTPYDMCVILNAAIENDLCREVLSARTWTTQAIMNNPDGTTISNWFLRRAEDHIDDWEILCGKTGYVNESGNCAVSFYQSASTGTNYIACTALTYSSWRCIYDHAAIYNTYAP